MSLVVETEPVVAAVDQEMWARIVLNLVSNALKYTEEGTVTVALRRADDEIVLTVVDTGIGIPLAEQGRIFERFHQVDSAGGRSREGTGIGLALVADLVTALGGQVKVTSKEGTGSAFTVTIPRVPTDATPADTHARVAELGAAFVGETRQWDQPSAAPVPGTGDRRILLVEDNADMRDYVTRLLTEQQWTVDAVADADAALAHARAARPDLVLSDVMLPGRDGLTLLRDLRADPSLARVPVILLTARAGTESTVEGLHHGADDYIVKPFHPSELIARVRVHLELSHFRETLIRQGEQEADGLRTSINTRGVIGQATGIIMAIHRCDTEAAFARLTVMSQHQNVKLRDLASDLVHKFVANLPT